MYTEDDEDVEVKNSNSNNYNDFYTSFNEPEDKNNKKKNSKKKKEEEKEDPKDESDYSNFYGIDEEESPSNDNPNRQLILKVILISLASLLILGLVILTLVRLFSDKVKGDIEIVNNNISLQVGENDYVSYTIVDTESEVTSTFTSSNEDVVVVDDNGKITAISEGEAKIIVHYTINDKTREKECLVTVTGGSNVNQELTLSLKFDNGSDNKWTNKDVKITVEANSVFGIDSINYATNCDSNCNYKKIDNNGVISITDEGTTKVIVVAYDKKKQENKKEVTVKIDKTNPAVEYKGEKDISSSKEVEVCATCSDSLSGCKNSKVCRKFTSSKSNQVITVYDNAGNKVNSPSFNVTIKNATQPCSLKVASDGTVTATLRETAEKYMFDDNTLSGKNALSKKITISASKAGESGAKIVNYYVKDKNGNIGQCYVTVIKECVCKDGSKNYSTCTAKCTFRAN